MRVGTLELFIDQRAVATFGGCAYTCSMGAKKSVQVELALTNKGGQFFLLDASQGHPITHRDECLGGKYNVLGSFLRPQQRRVARQDSGVAQHLNTPGTIDVHHL